MKLLGLLLLSAQRPTYSFVASPMSKVAKATNDETARRFSSTSDDDDASITDTLIIGGGVAGTASAFALCHKKGKDVILCEQGSSLAPSSASSNGDSRMYRKMYSNEFFSKMQASALGRWADVERITGESLLQENGLLFYGEDTGETVEGSVLGAKEVMEKLNLPHEFYPTGDDIAAAYPALAAGCKGKPYSGVYEKTAGHIRASKACHAMIKAANANDGDNKCDVRLNTKIVSLDTSSSDKVVAITEDGSKIIAKNVVICAGPWTNSVLKASNLPPIQLEIWQVQWGHYEVTNSDADAHNIPQAFHFRKETGIDGGLYYVFPASATECLQQQQQGDDENKRTFVKVGVDFPTGKALQDMGEFNYEGSEKVQQLMDEWANEHIVGDIKRVDSYCHPYTMTSDSYFVIDKLSDNVAIFAGGSGRAFKFGPLLGDCIASLLSEDENEEPPVDLTPFKVSRDATRATTIVS